MATGSTRAASIKTPGVQTADTQDSNEGPAFSPEAGDPGADAADTAVAPAFEMPADLAAFIKAEIAKGVAAGVAALRPAAAAPSAQAELPSQAEAMKQVKSGGRAVLSTAGYVCPLPEDVAVQRDANGFAKS